MRGLTPDEIKTLVELMTHNRWAALATVNHDEPLASQVAVAVGADAGTFLMHLSDLAPHTRNLLAHPQASLLFAQRDVDPGTDPQTLARVSLQGVVTEILREHAEYADARRRYLAALPQAEVQFGLGDFHLLRFRADQARYICGFGRAHQFGRDRLNDYLTSSSR